MQKTILLGLTILILSCSDKTRKYYDSGELKEIQSHKKVEQDTIRHGEWKGFHKNGQIATTGFYKDGKKEGNWERFHEQGNLKEEAVYLNDQEHGETRTYNKNGTPYEKIVFINGIKHGAYKSYYENGQLAHEGVYFQDEKIGFWTDYYSNGNIERTGKWENGKKIGPHHCYDRNGNKALIYYYDLDGSENGMVEFWSVDRVLFSMCTLKYGRHEVCTTYNKDGSIQEVIRKD